MSTKVRFEDVKKFFEDDDWSFEVKDNSIRCGIKAKNESFKIRVVVRTEKELISLYVYYPITVPEDKRREVCETITRMNYGLSFGWCEMDMNDGELRFRSFMPTDDAPFFPEQLKTILYSGVNTADRYFPAFMSVIYGNKSSEEAIKEIEN